MKRALIVASVGVLASTVWVVSANAQANINPNVYRGNTSGPYGAQAPWEWHAGPGPMRRGNKCVEHVDHRVGPPAAELRSNAFCRSARHWAALTIRCDCLAGSAMDGPSDRPSRRRKNFSSAVARHRGRAAECSCARDQRKAPRHPALAAMSARRAVVVMAADAAAASHRQHRRGRGRIAYRAVRRPAWDR